MRTELFLSAAIAAALASAVRGADPLITPTAGGNSFALSVGDDRATIAYDAGDYKVVQIAANMLAADIEQVTGKKPPIVPTDAATGLQKTNARRVVLLGTLGHSPAIDALVAAKKIDVTAIQGKWESYLVTRVPDAATGIEALAIIGSDRRGTAYGATALSEAMGVSPWVWWADVPAVHHDNLYVTPGGHGEPSVKYRGIFINDEDWGMQPWAAKTFEPKSAGGVGDIGPKTYAKVFELLLRLHANYCWPAMHPCTQAFNIYPQNKFVADDYAIVMGSSHCEQLLRNGVTEWKDAQGRVGEAAAATYNWVTNSAGILDYWKQRLQENGKFENTYMLGLRGVHDSDMAGGGTAQQKAQRLNQIYAAQRDLLKQYVNPDVARVPQLVCPYKEALIYYQNGAVPPDDVTMVWADDNHGYIRQLSTPAEQKRSGGAGVYYHISYWGAPHDYLWLNSTPPSLIWEELSKAYDYNARTVWVINVGDLKPGEIGISMAMSLAYDSSKFSLETIGNFLPDFAAKTFGAEHAAAIADVLSTYYHLNYERKPEHLGFNTSQNPTAAVKPTEFSDEEIAQRLAAYHELAKKADAIYALLPKEQRDAFDELVIYPVRCSALQNEKILCLDMNHRAAAAGHVAEQNAYADRSVAAYDQIQAETAYFNDSLAGGKWKNMMSDNPHNQDVFKAPKVVRAAAAASGPAQAGIPAEIPPAPLPAPAGSAAFAESAGYLSIAAEHPTRNIPRGAAAWKVIPGLGRLGDSMAVFPTTTPSIPNLADLAANAPALEYDFTTTTADSAAKLTIEAIPTHRINSDRGLRYAAAIDGDAPQIVNLETPENNAVWATNVLRGSAFGATTHNLPAGKHTLHIYMVDPGVVLDHITIDLGKLPKGYLPPTETR